MLLEQESPRLDYEPSSFSKDLNLTLTLSVDGKKAEILSGNIEDVSMDFHTYGFAGKIHFSSFNNESLDAIMLNEKPIDISLKCALFAEVKGLPDPLWEIKGLVTEKFFKKTRQLNTDDSMQYYVAHFADIAQVIWSHHFPVNIYVKKTLKDVIDEHKTPLIDITYDWDVLEKEHPVLAFALQHKENSFGDKGVSFYSFLHWFLYRENGMLLYDFEKNNYSIKGKKDEPSGDPVEIFESWVDPPVCHFPELARFERSILTHSAEKVEKKLVHVFDPYEKIRDDIFDPAEYKEFPELHPIAAASDLTETKHLLEVNIATFEDDFCFNHIMPGSFFKFLGDNKTEGTWSKHEEIKGKIFRLRKLAWQRGMKEMPSEDIEKKGQPYNLVLKLWLEDKEETHIDRPPFTPPTYPFYLQGKVHSQIGEEKQTTFEIDEEVEGGQFLVEIPIVEGDDKKVVVPFTPTMISGQYYFPLCKDEKVLLAIYFQTAHFSRVLDWQPLTKLPSGIQGNQIVFASNNKDYHTWLRHEFDEGKHSVFTIEQTSSSKQKRTIELKDKTMSHTVINPDEKEITVIYDEEKGTTLHVKDNKSGIEQTTTFDGKAMTHTCKGDKTSQIIQKPDSITVDVETFTVQAKDIHLNAKNEIIQEGKSKVGIKTKVADIDAPTVNLGS